MRRLLLRLLALSVLGLLMLGGWVVWLNRMPPLEPGGLPADAAQARLRGAYLARAGNCAACHTRPGGLPYAGGRAIETPFGTVFSSNLTPDRIHGLGAWSADDFWRALRHGQSRDGRWLSPAFPYTSYSLMQRQDSDDLYAFLSGLPAVAQANRPAALRFPFDTQAALGLWRALYFRPATLATRPDKSPSWNRGAYLVRALGHCGDCHSPRSALGGIASDDLLDGSLMPMRDWYAPSLRAPHEAGVSDWPRDQVLALLGTGMAARGSVLGPMAEIVQGSTQHLSADDRAAMVDYLQDLPASRQPRPAQYRPAAPGLLARGQEVYEQHCKDCHGAQGQGAPGAYPPLAGNRAVELKIPQNLIKVVIEGGFAPVTEGNPRPYGMPPFSHQLDDGDIAAVLSYVRQSWGNRADAVTANDVARAR